MILRTYRTRVHPSKVEAYVAFEKTEGLPMVRKMRGCLGAGFGRVAEAAEPTYHFVSLWMDRASLEKARASRTWKQTAGKLESLGFSLGGDLAEHLEVVAWDSAAAAENP